MYLYPCSVTVTLYLCAVGAVLHYARGCYVFPNEASDPCAGVRCAHGSRCHASADGRTAECRCPAACPRYGDDAASRPVCGSDGIDYAGECELRRAACDARANVTVKYAGKCDPCLGITCPEPEICQLDINRAASCRCAEPCPLEFAPVCSSDGKTYSNECQMRREACRSRKQLRIIYRGQCSSGVNPCESLRCLVSEECAIDRFGIARCSCPSSCEPIVRPVCGSDGHTYDNSCELKRATCEHKSDVQEIHSGVCGAEGGCAGHTCPYGGTCTWSEGRASCSCPRCPAEFAPVCGSDGISYGNKCKLQLEACRHRRHLSVLYEGPCNGCENKKCPHYGRCESEGGDAKCVCPNDCHKMLNNSANAVSPPETTGEKVCGSDGNTYLTDCHLRTTSCQEQREITVDFKGYCSLCAGVQCANGARCSGGECVCPTRCTDARAEPVCASTMRTYASECELQRAACTQPGLAVIFYGDCAERFAVAGVPTSLPPSPSLVTLISNEIAHGSSEPPEKSWTNAEREACKDIHCDYEATCELGPDNFPRCSCLFDCSIATQSEDNKPVCASDLRVYPSMCHMKLEACQRQEELRLRPLELCQGLEIKPCNGDTPLVDNLTGIELDCGNGPHRKDCPSGSYCHQTMRVARCCKKSEALSERIDCVGGHCGSPPPFGAGSAPSAAAEGALPGVAPSPDSRCGCHRLGAYGDACDAAGRCACRPGVGGVRCDRCEPGFWGLPRISSGHKGCIPCGCSMFGSVREDCEQMTGRCVCKPDIQGQKCTICTNHEMALGPNGCFSPDVIQLPPSGCKYLNCYFGAQCAERGGIAVCECPLIECPPESMDTLMVCGSDGQTYTSECHLKLQACRTQTDIVVQAFGICREDALSGTDWPLRRYTPQYFTQPDVSHVHLSKSTRHIQVQSPRIIHYTELDRNASSTDPDIAGNRKAVGGGGRTTAAVVSITALIGDLCAGNADCMIPDTRCERGACLCARGYRPSPNRQECLEPGALPEQRPIANPLACDSSPCRHAVACLDMPDGDFTCVCESLTTGPLCEQKITLEYFDIPAFAGSSYIAMKPLNAYHKFDIEIEFRAFSDNGILLFDQQKYDGSGDFISIALINGRVEMRYNLGDGLISLVSPETIQLQRLHKISAKRYHRDSMLKLDDGEDTTSQSKGKLKALDLKENSYIGFVPTNYSRVFDNIGTRQGFIGCIHRINIARVSAYPSRALHAHAVRECSRHPCASLPCAHGATCFADEENDFSCSCASGYEGARCERTIKPCALRPCAAAERCVAVKAWNEYACVCDDIMECGSVVNGDSVQVIPIFDGISYIQLPLPSGTGKIITIEFSFITNDENGMIMYAAQHYDKMHGDFLTLNLVDGFLQFRFNLGSGIANISSYYRIRTGVRYSVRARRVGRDALLLVEGPKDPADEARKAKQGAASSNNLEAAGSAPPHKVHLNLKTPLYLGYIPEKVKLHRLSGITRGLKGSIEKMTINGQKLNILGHRRICSSEINNELPCSSVGVRHFRGDRTTSHPNLAYLQEFNQTPNEISKASKADKNYDRR